MGVSRYNVDYVLIICPGIVILSTAMERSGCRAIYRSPVESSNLQKPWRTNYLYCPC